jgi:predicted acetyltransferase
MSGVPDLHILPHPGELADPVIALRLREVTPAIPEKGWAPAYHFTIVRRESDDPIGLLSLRVGSSDWLQLYAGHIGIAIAEPHRGHRYACHAVCVVAPLAWTLGIAPNLRARRRDARRDRSTANGK